METLLARQDKKEQKLLKGGLLTTPSEPDNAPPLMDISVPIPGPPTAAPALAVAARGGSQTRCGSQARNTTIIQQTDTRGHGTNPGSARRPHGPRRGGSSTRSRGGAVTSGSCWNPNPFWDGSHPQRGGRGGLVAQV
jgi:hypothetical protein